MIFSVPSSLSILRRFSTLEMPRMIQKAMEEVFFPQPKLRNLNLNAMLILDIRQHLEQKSGYVYHQYMASLFSDFFQRYSKLIWFC